MSIMHCESDAVSDDPIQAYRFLLITLDNALGSEECRKLCFLAADIGISKSKLEHVRHAIDIFDELETSMLIATNDVSVLMEMMSLIHRKDLMKKIQTISPLHTLKNVHTSKFSKFRLLLLEIADNTSDSELEIMKHFCKDILGRQALSKLKDVIQLFSLLEERRNLAATQLGFLQQMLQICGNRRMLEKTYQFIVGDRSRVPTDVELVELSSHLAAEWQKLGTYLGLQHDVLKAINQDHRTTQDRTEAMLFTWRYSYRSDDAYGTLSQALKSCHRNDLAVRIDAIATSRASVSASATVPYKTSSQPLQPVHVDYEQPLWNPSGHSLHPTLMTPWDFLVPPVSSEVPLHTAVLETTKHDYDMNLPDQVLVDLSCHIASDWYTIGTYLQLQSNTLKRIQNSDYQHSAANKAQEMLMTWRKSLQPNDNGIAILASVLKVVGRLDLSEQLKGISPTLSPTTALAEQMRCLDVEKCQLNDNDGRSGNNTVKPLMIHVAHQESHDEYRMNRNPRGLCIIINNINFEKRDLKKRNGSEIDQGKLQNVFDKLHFKVQVREDLKADMMFSLFKEVSQMDHSQFDCFACCIMSHGKLGDIYGSDGETIEIQEILGLFKPVSCRSLNNKPKLFFIQACQGNAQQEEVAIETDEPLGMGSAIRKTLPIEADFLLSYATVPGYVSYRSTTEGSWYVSALVDELNKHHDELDLIRIMTRVNNRLSESVAKVKAGHRKQVAAPSFTLRKDLYLRQLQI